MLSADQIETMFPDIVDPLVESALALVHQRFSTNTFPSWPLAHPYRYIAHNGEINTLRGNINWMHAREALCRSSLLGDDLKKILPIVVEGGSDSAIFDNVLELLVMAGRPLPLAVLMMIPEAWSGHESMPALRKDFYEYHGCLMEPWDGPASIAFTDGTVIGAVLDRNGLRPSRYYVTKDGLVVMASEVGVLDIPPERVLIKERLHPGRIFLVDTAQGRIIDDARAEARLRDPHPYGEWLATHLTPLESLPEPPHLPEPAHETVLERQQAFGYTHEDLRLLLGPMATAGEEPIGSMGTDTSLAVLSDRPRLLYDYFKQLFAQVTNPPLDGIREELVTQIATSIGPEGNLLEPTPEACRQIKLKTPILDNAELARIRHVDRPGFKATTVPMLFSVADGPEGLARAMEELCRQASQAVDAGFTYLILSDRGVDREHAPIPALLATAGVHHHLIREGKRVKVGLVIETGEPREVHHMALLLGYGAGAINPYLAFETLDDMIRQGMLPALDHKTAVKNYIKALNKGVLKVISKMGISTIQSYRAAQIFEAIGLAKDFVDRYFTWTASRIGGIGIDVIAKEALAAPPPRLPRAARGRARARLGRRVPVAARRRVPPLQSRHRLQAPARHALEAVRDLQGVHGPRQHGRTSTWRRCAGSSPSSPRPTPIPLEEVEPVEAILRRFATGAMSYGSIGLEAHETLAIAMNRMGGRSNTGEGGEDPARYVRDAERRLAAQRDQAGRLRALRRHERVPDQRGRAPDQDGPGRQARRGRPAARPQGLSLDRQGPALDAGRGAHLPAPAPRHLLDRGPGPADPRPQELEPAGADQRQAGGRGRASARWRRAWPRPTRTWC